MKKFIVGIIYLLWRLQFKKLPIVFPTTGYHCRECIGGKELDCGAFKCPCLPKEKLVPRFTFIKYNQLIIKLKGKLL
jgi:hypothetical protein